MARGPKPSITLEVVNRVSERFGRGMPLRMALEAEGNGKINVDTWEKALKKCANFRGIYGAAKGKFLEEAMRKLAQSEDLKHVCWLLERRHSDLFARPPDTSVQVNQSTTVAIPAEVLERARDLANGSSNEKK